MTADPFVRFGDTTQCRYCGTIQESGVDIDDYCPQVGDGCERCYPTLDEANRDGAA